MGLLKLNFFISNSKFNFNFLCTILTDSEYDTTKDGTGRTIKINYLSHTNQTKKTQKPYHFKENIVKISILFSI